MIKKENSDLPVKMNKDIFSKIKDFILKIFRNGNKKQINEYKEEKQSYKKVETFIDDIKFADEYQEERSIKTKLDKKEIKITDLTSIQKQKMIEFYKKEIARKEEKLNNIKQRILKLRHA